MNDLKSNYEEINIISLEITSISDFYNVKVILGIQDNLNFNSDIFAGLKSKLEERFNKKINFTFIPLTLYSGNSNLDLTPIQIEKNKIYLIFTNFINKNISKGISLKNLNVTINDLDSKANVDLVFDVENQSMNKFTKFIDNLSEQQVSKSVNINLKYFKYEELMINPENIATGSLESQSLVSEKR